MATIETGTQNSAPKRARDEEIGSGPVNDKRWPGWPGENVFRLLVPTQKVGGIIGRKGEFVKKMCEETKSRIKILDGVSGAPERIVMVSAKEEPEAALSPAMDGVLQVHKLLVEGANAPGEAGRAQQGWSGTILTRMLLAGMQSGSLIGKQGATIKSIQESSGASARVIEDVPPYALSDDKVLEIQGDSTKVHKALELVLAHLRKFLVDRSVLPLFEMNTPKGHQPQMEQPPPHQPWNPNQASSMPPVGGNSYGNNANYAPSMPQHDSYYPPSDMPPPENHPHHGLSMYGREPPHAGVPPMVNQQQPVIQQVTKRMQIPLSYADAVIGTNGANISYCRRNSGSVITIEETRGVPGEMTVEIIGTASQVQTAQQLIQNYIASASAPPSDPYHPPMDQGYNSYPSHNPVYGSSPHIAGHTGPPGYASHTGHAGHAAHTGHPAGPYESSYPGSYRY